jgi:hypothetical protein
MIVSVIAYLMWIRLWVDRNVHGFVSIDVHRLVHWPVLVGVFVAGFILEYRRASRRRWTFPGGVAQ